MSSPDESYEVEFRWVARFRGDPHIGVAIVTGAHECKTKDLERWTKGLER
jgi:hypothetical protein